MIRVFDVRDKYQGGFTKKRVRTDYIVIHHAASHYKQATGLEDVEAVRKWHMEQGHKWPGIGYHVALAEETNGGEIARYDLSDLDTQRAHVFGQNHIALGVACLTDFGTEWPAVKWLDAMAGTVASLLRRYPAALVVGHQDITLPGHGTTCPGSRWPEWKPLILEPNWAALWGVQPYRPTYGIPRAWKREHVAGRPLGMAQTDEVPMLDGRTIQAFDRGAIVHTPGKGEEVWR